MEGGKEGCPEFTCQKLQYLISAGSGAAVRQTIVAADDDRWEMEEEREQRRSRDTESSSTHSQGPASFKKASAENI